MGANLHPAYHPAPPRPRLSGSPRVDEKAADLLRCSADHAKRLRIAKVPEAIVAILTACTNDTEKADTFRRRCEDALALGDTPVDLSPALLRRVFHADAEGDAALGVAAIDGITPAEAQQILPRIRMKVAVLADLARALERRAREATA